ncbi:uncharacterized protein H6S33_005188 [Morchella sextelata]|uniref:uncharacterized protein n=1 Tax=Morchella sextelata TaxID=1174677 RepID=UPI001D04F2FE|nr:uncharacterized protein H6S33_005188 [Morchella sextelata]KAH0605206.1 hypothetical protein H6S33_005188 [Morchella sextelata]
MPSQNSTNKGQATPAGTSTNSTPQSSGQQPATTQSVMLQNYINQSAKDSSKTWFNST